MALGLAACGEGEAPSSAAPGAPPGAPHQDSDEIAGEVTEDAGPPSFGCEARPPAGFITQCSGCHTLGGTNQGGKIPDLRMFAGTEAEFVTQVRRGGGGMPAFSEAKLSDAGLHEVYTFLRQGDPGAQSGQAGGSGGEQNFGLGNVSPLFGENTALAVSFLRDDGVLITRGAGRVRGRHELEGTYGPFGPLYFEGRTFGFVIEDFTVRGENRIVVSYLPLARPQDKTNFRAFKIYGDGNVFHANTGMDSDTPLPSLAQAGSDPAQEYATRIAAFARVQSHEVKGNARTGKPLQAGELFEFEFGVFIEPSAVRANSRTAYYTDTFRYRVGQGGLTMENADTSGQLGPTMDAQLGGATTVAWAYAEPELYFSQLASNTQHEHVQAFVDGRRLFHTDFDTGAHSEAGNPAFDAQAHKLGPLFVSHACVNCHVRNGGGETLVGSLSETSTMAFKLYDAGAELGNQLQLQEGLARSVAPEQREVSLSDGTQMLSRPTFEVQDKTGRELAYSARVARRLVGLGLLEAIDETTLLSRADPQDCDGDGISGRPHLVADPERGVLRVGRFGWRAEKVSVEHQVADALSADLGVSSRVLPGSAQAAGAGGAAGAQNVELDDDGLRRLTTYMRLLGVPPQRAADSPTVMRGETVFHEVGCANCHVSALTTGSSHPFIELRGQSIRPYTDLLLHDLGPDLSRCQRPAGPRRRGAAGQCERVAHRTAVGRGALADRAGLRGAPARRPSPQRARSDSVARGRGSSGARAGGRAVEGRP
ncbi:MAG: di-heme oxidoredictase family protein [Myxococcales bacterium]